MENTFLVIDLYLFYLTFRGVLSECKQYIGWPLSGVTRGVFLEQVRGYVSGIRQAFGFEIGATNNRLNLTYLDIQRLNTVSDLPRRHAQQPRRLGLHPARLFQGCDDLFTLIHVGIIDIEGILVRQAQATL